MAWVGGASPDGRGHMACGGVAFKGGGWCRGWGRGRVCGRGLRGAGAQCRGRGVCRWARPVRLAVQRVAPVQVQFGVPEETRGPLDAQRRGSPGSSAA